jgi:putative membrane-bound dehydrogenase-like protein
MRKPVFICLSALCLAASAFAEDPDSGFRPIFDGQSLDGWKGAEGFWRVENGTIIGQTTEAHPLPKNTFLVWDRGEVDDFELRLKFRISGTEKANSGIQFRGTQREDGHVIGYQADIDRAGQWIGAIYDEQGRKLLAGRGQKSVITKDGKIEPEQVADAGQLLKNISVDGWNDYSILARGNHLVLKINGQVTAEVIDNDPAGLDRIGKLALQLHQGPPMKVEFKDIRLKRLPLEDGWKKVVFIAGTASHGYFSHEHNAGCLLLSKDLQIAQRSQGLPVISTVYTNGWPKDPTAFDNADTVVAYCDGGARHFLNDHLDQFDELVDDRGVGLVCLHYGVETVPGPPGEHFLKWIGGYFEPNWSVNPHWTADYETLPKHPITRGVEPFAINDEWYYHMRFTPEMKGVTPILTALPPRETLNRKDGSHSGNPAVREAVLVRNEPQHTAWAFERPDGKGRGFGFTGGHFHVNWQENNFRKLVLNAIVWTAHVEVPQQGVVTPPPSQQELEANQDEQRPENFQFKPPVGKSPSQPAASASPKTAKPSSGDVAPLFKSAIVTPQTPGHAVDIDVDITGAKSLFLVITDAGDGIGCDWADWAEPRLIFAEGETKLTELKWTSAETAWNQVRINENAAGQRMSINGKEIAYGLGAHATSLIEYTLPQGKQFTRFKARGGIDDGGAKQGCGSTVQFLVFTQRPGAQQLAALKAAGTEASHEAAAALEQLDVHPDLRATLFASEPMMTNPSTIDIDHLGRVWMCEAINYRAFRNADVIGKEHGADRILVLEDTNGDGTADRSTVFHEDHDVDSAHGILVLPTATGQGLRLLVSALDSIFYLIDDDGDLKSDRKELLFTGIGGAQHDHGIHAVHFGPDGKLYFNFGNAGQHIKDKNGQQIIDKSGREVSAHRKPYQEGMVFRCNTDGSEFETLAWNFRNNWEVCIDSFGTIWQSDNDDDGNRGVRINYVMEFGNYGYKDELTGASWQTPRTNWEAEIPLRHWHLNDPGVIPNLLQTGAGAPTGICVYEGQLLPQALRGAIIHCDAGANICRAYVPKPEGAGYSAQVVDLLNGTRNRWFRPSDVCIAPDGSLMVADWYDPGVGGHRMGDVAHGRIFRLAPASTTGYRSPAIDVSTAEGALQALRSPNMSARYLAWTALHGMGEKAIPALDAVFRNDPDERIRARAQWLLIKSNTEAGQLAWMNPLKPDGQFPENLRLVSIRGLRQTGFQGVILPSGLKESPALRRELCIMIHGKSGTAADNIWAQLASLYKGDDRWELEALGIGAEGQWNSRLAAWLKKAGETWKTTKAGRDIIWRSRADETPQLLVEIIKSSQTPLEEVPRFLRALDFQQGPSKQDALTVLAFTTTGSDAERSKLVRAEALSRLDNLDLNAHPQYRKAIEEVLRENLGTAQFVMLVNRFNLTDRYPDLVTLARENAHSQLAVDAIKALFDKQQASLLKKVIQDENREQTDQILAALATAGDKRCVPLLMELVKDAKRPLWVRQGAVKALGACNPGAQALLGLAKKGDYAAELKQALAAALSTASLPGVREQALKIFPPPPGKNASPLPPIPELAGRKGNAEQGKMIFNTTGTCNKCHQINGIGQEIGPNLSEIGKKLARPALYESILFPSAGISHGFENWLIVTDDGQIATGLLISETDQELKIKDDKGIVRTIPVQNIEIRKKQDVSLMPADLQRLMTSEELVDLVEYLTTLKQRRL